jgi:hypothetical protein
MLMVQERRAGSFKRAEADERLGVTMGQLGGTATFCLVAVAPLFLMVRQIRSRRSESYYAQ